MSTTKPIDMKKSICIYYLLFGMCLLFFASCQKAPYLTVNSQKSFTFSEAGGSESISFTCNRDWNATSSVSWLKISPSSGSANEEGARITITCDANTTYDARTCTITLTSEGISESFTVSQNMNLGLSATPTSFELSNEKQTISVKAQSNVQYSVVVDDDCKSWISVVQTKALAESTVTLTIAKNDGYERTGKVTLKYDNLQEIISIQQQCANVEFDNAQFKEYCVENFDKNGDGEVSLLEALEVEEIDISNLWEIKSIGGIECFTNIKKLVFEYVWMDSIDISHNTKLLYLKCTDAHLNSLDLSKNTALIELDIHFNGVKVMPDISRNTALESLNIHGCDFESIDVSNCRSLKVLDISSTKIPSIDISNNNALDSLICIQCKALKNLDLRKNTTLRYLDVQQGVLTSLDVTNNPELTYLMICSNPLNNINLSKNTKLRYLNCADCKITNLDVSNCPGLVSLICYRLPLTTLDLRYNVALEELLCYRTQLTELKLDNNQSLKRINCANTELSEIDLSSNNELELLNCQYTHLTSLDVSNNLKLHTLVCTHNTSLSEIWLNKGQTIPSLIYDTDIATIRYKE